LTPVQSNTLSPTWPDQKRANYVLPKDAEITLELWDSNPIHHHPICLKTIKDVDEHIVQDTLTVECASGAEVRLTIAPARPKLGLGLYYELRTSDIAVTRVIQHSPAAWAGIRKGDVIVSIQGREVKKMQEGEAQSLINAHSRTGVQLQVQAPEKPARRVLLKEGPMYPTVDEGLRF
jgi:predicted metalloprotease with PDZ domain